ncbi:MAG: sugar phosphorylase [Verrucomicrobia bacterium]|nr:sugar phosphorylase [Verrucomicrobiota bacterium]MCF7707475.1 sugar phosphorylase [Verrucomicrobiota bacterium]
MESEIFEHISFIYGEAAAHDITRRILETTQKYKSAVTKWENRHPKQTLTEQDSMLITYGDQLQNGSEPPLRTLKNFLDTHIKDSISAVHLLPFFPYSSDDGFSVIDYYTVDPALGSWNNITALAEEFDLMFDAVFNHISAKSAWFEGFLDGDPRYADFFIQVEGEPELSSVVRPRSLPLLTKVQTKTGETKVWTTFSPDQIDLNLQNPEVLLALIDVFLFYLSKGARFIRLDAITFIWKQIGTSCIHLPQTHRLVQLMRSLTNEIAPGVRIITETNVPHKDNISYFGDGTNEAHLVYNFTLSPLTLHAFQTGCATELTRWAAELELSHDTVTFLNFLASHDGIGLNPVKGILANEQINALVNRTTARGGFISYKTNPDGSLAPYEMNINYLDALIDPADAGEPLMTAVNRFVAAHALMLSMRGLPAVYFHSLFGSRGDRIGAETSGINRRINREKFRLDQIESELSTHSSIRSTILSQLKSLLDVRREHPAFNPYGIQQVLETTPQTFAVLRVSPNAGETCLCLFNVSGDIANINPHDLIKDKNRLTPLYSNKPLPAGSPIRALQPYQFLWARVSD